MDEVERQEQAQANLEALMDAPDYSLWRALLKFAAWIGLLLLPWLLIIDMIRRLWP